MDAYELFASSCYKCSKLVVVNVLLDENLLNLELKIPALSQGFNKLNLTASSFEQF